MTETGQELFWGLILCSLWCIGFRQLFQPDMILDWLGDYLWKVLPEWLSKPLFQCTPCMGGFHGALFYILFMGTKFILIVPFVVTLVGLNALVQKGILEDKNVINHY